MQSRTHGTYSTALSCLLPHTSSHVSVSRSIHAASARFMLLARNPYCSRSIRAYSAEISAGLAQCSHWTHADRRRHTLRAAHSQATHAAPSAPADHSACADRTARATRATRATHADAAVCAECRISECCTPEHACTVFSVQTALFSFTAGAASCACLAPLRATKLSRNCRSVHRSHAAWWLGNSPPAHHLLTTCSPPAHHLLTT